MKDAADVSITERYEVPPDTPNERKVNGRGTEPASIVLPFVRASSFVGKPVPLRRWFVPGIIPSGVVTLFGGDGGVGKSTLIQQLAVCAVGGRDWLGLTPEAGPVIFLTAEDDLDELHRRLVAMASGLGVDLAALEDLHLCSIAGWDAVMGIPDRAGQIVATPLWQAVLKRVDEIKPRAVVLETLSDIFGGEENIRRQVRQFMGIVRKPAIEGQFAVIIPMHPSNDGLRSGSGASGSTAWNGSARARLYLETVKDEQDREIDADIRVLRLKKANYGPTDLEFRLRRLDGFYKVDGAAGDSFLNKVAANAKAEDKFLDLLAKITAQGRKVTEKASRSGASVVFAKHPDAAGTRKEGFDAAMERLLAADRIHVEPFGPPSKDQSHIVVGPRPKETAL